jgi:NhaA family Na+:H+ antiporter
VTDGTDHVTWARSERFVPRAFIRPFIRFSNREASSGLVLIGAAIAALIWANLWPGAYEELLGTRFRFDFGPLRLDEDLHHLINDGFMAVFFFVVGLEIKRELVVGELRDRRAAALPVIAAVGGMVAPALIYLAIAGASGEPGRGWGIPMATDIAFAIGVLSLVGKRVPLGAKLFLLTLAIADDIGAIVVIAVFYTSELSVGWLAAAGGGLVAVLLAQRIGVRSYTLYAPLAIMIWFATLESGVHATLAGVALGLLTPARPYYDFDEFNAKGRELMAELINDDDNVSERELADHSLLTISAISRESVSPLARIEDRLGNWSSFVVVPLFALANAGINFQGTSVTDGLFKPVGLGVALGLVVGKIVGVTGFTLAAMRIGTGRLPRGMTARHLLGVATVAGIGFTVSLFIAGLAFTDPDLIESAKVGIFGASIVAALLGWLILRTGESQTGEAQAGEEA